MDVSLIWTMQPHLLPNLGDATVLTSRLYRLQVAWESCIILDTQRGLLVAFDVNTS